MVFKELVLVTVDETEYLCKLVEKENGIVLELAEEEGSSVEDTIFQWIKSNNIGDTETIEFSKLTAYSVKKLKSTEIIYFENQWNKMKEIKKTSVARLENKYFSENS